MPQSNRKPRRRQASSVAPVAADNVVRSRVRDISVRLELLTEALTRKDMQTWRRAWQWAINVDQPNRTALYRVYTDVEADTHLSACVAQRMGAVMAKGFKVIGPDGEERPQLTELFEAPWFKDFLRFALESRYWGHSLIELGPVVSIDGRLLYDYVALVPRTHVIPEFGVIVVHENDTWQTGTDYRSGELARWCVEVGRPDDLGLYLKCAQHTIPKKNMCAFWDMFGEIFGMPLRVATTTSRDQRDMDRIEKMLQKMGAAAYGVFPEGTTIEMKESFRIDAYNVYNERIKTCNSEMSKCILTVTMTTEDGSSRSQSETHKEMLQHVIDSDCDLLRDVINWQLMPRMIAHGFPLQGCRFDWDEPVTYTPEQRVAYERLVMEHYEVDPQYFIDTYNIPIIGTRQPDEPQNPDDPDNNSNDNNGNKNRKDTKKGSPNTASHKPSQRQAAPDTGFFD